MFSLIILCAIAFAAGFASGLGSGSGLILIPSLIFYDYPAYVALATNKFLATIANGYNVLILSRHSKLPIKRQELIKVIPVLVISSICGAYLTPHIKNSVLIAFIAVLMLVIPLINLFSKESVLTAIKDGLGRHIASSSPGFYLCLFVLGLYSAAVGLGTGVVFLLLGGLIYRSTYSGILLFSKTMLLIVNATALMTFALGYHAVHFRLAMPLMVFSLMGVYLSTRVIAYLPEKGIKIIINCLVLVMGVLLLCRDLR